MAVKIRLKRMGKIRAPFYRVVVMDSRTKRDGRAIEEIGKYHPTEEPSLIDIDMERANYWLARGAQPTEAVAVLLKKSAEGTVLVKAAKPSKRELYEAALAAAGKSADAADTSGATTPRKRAAAKKDEATEAPVAEAPVAEAPAADELTLADSATDAPAAEAPAAAAALPTGAVAATDDGSAPEGHAIKGNADSGLYHAPGGRWYDATVAEFWFATEEDAQAAGFKKAGS